MEWTKRGRRAYDSYRAQPHGKAQWALAWARTVMEAERHEDWPSVTSDWLFTIDGLGVRVESAPDDDGRIDAEDAGCTDHEHIGLIGFIDEESYDSCWGFCDVADPDGCDYLLTSAYEIARETAATYRDEQARLNRQADELVLSVL